MTLQRTYTFDKGIETQSQYAAVIPLSFSYAFQNKAPLKGNASYTHFRPAAFSLAELVKHVLSGHAFMPAQHKPFQRSNASFQCAQLLVLDFDNDDSGTLPVSVQALQEHAFVGRFASFIYATPSSTQAVPKSRAVFVLDSLLSSVDDYERAAAALIDVCKDLHPDTACKDASRLFYGSFEAEHYIDAQAVLKIGLLEELAALQDVLSKPAITEPQNHHTAAAPVFDLVMPMHHDSAAYRAAELRRRAYVETAFDQNISDIRTQAKGNRNNAFWRLTCNLLNVQAAAPDLLNMTPVIDAAAAAAHAAGLEAKEIEASVQSALKTPRRALGGQWLSIQAALNAARYETPLRIVWPVPAEHPEHQDDEKLHQDDKAAYSALPDSVRYLVASENKGAAALLNALYVAQAQSILSHSFDLQGVIDALAALGTQAAKTTLARSLKWLRDAGLLKKESSSNELISQMSHRETPITTCDISEINSKRGPRQITMSLLPMPEFMARLKDFVAYQTLDSLYPDKPAREIDSRQIDAYYLPIMVRVLETMARRRITALKVLHVQDALSDSERTYAAALLDMIHSLPAVVTSQALIDTLDLNPDTAAAAAERLSAIRISTSAGLMRAMELKASLMTRIYKARIESLDNPISTPLVLEMDGQAFIDTLRHECAKVLSGQAVSGRAMAAVFGMHERRSAYRAAKGLGIERHERKEIVSIPEPERAAIKAAEQSAKGKCVRVVAYDADGSVIGAAAAFDAEKLPKNAARYDAHIQQASLMLVGQMPERIERMPRIAAAHAQDVSPDTEQTARAAQPERIPRKRLYTPAFLLSRILAPRIAQHAGLWVHPETGELFDDAISLIYALIDQTEAVAS